MELHRLACWRLPVDTGLVDGLLPVGVVAVGAAAGNGVDLGLGEGMGETLLELWLSECKEPVDW